MSSSKSPPPFLWSFSTLWLRAATQNQVRSAVRLRQNSAKCGSSTLIPSSECPTFATQWLSRLEGGMEEGDLYPIVEPGLVARGWMRWGDDVHAAVSHHVETRFLQPRICKILQPSMFKFAWTLDTQHVHMRFTTASTGQCRCTNSPPP